MMKSRFFFGISQNELAIRTGLPQPTISLLERGLLLPSQKQAELLAGVLGVTVKSLFAKKKEE